MLARAVIPTVLFVVAAGCAAPGASLGDSEGDVFPAAVTGGSGGGGGAVGNAPPVVAALVADRTSGDNAGAFVVVLTGSVSDANTERDLVSIGLAATGPSAIATAVHTITPDDRKKDEPEAFAADGFKIWDATRNDGILQFRYHQAFPAFTPAGA